MRSLITALHDLLFPPLCFSCERHLEHSSVPLFCHNCLRNIKAITSPLCDKCGIPFKSGLNHLCGNCLRRPPKYDLLRASFIYEKPISTLLMRLKYSRASNVLPTICGLAQQTDSFSQLSEPDIILPVPLHISRLRERQFNQSLAISKGCFPHWNNRIKTDQLRRHIKTSPQSLLSGKARRQNVKGSFRLKKDHSLTGKRVLLVDDVITTGSTVDECVRVLLSAKPASIEVFVIARSATG